MHHSPTFSILATNIRRLARTGEMDVIQACNRIKFLDDNPEGALDLAREAHDRAPSARLLQYIGETHAVLGNQLEAACIFRAVDAMGGDLHVANMIQAGLPKTRAMVDDDRRLLYIPIPKCGSSTVKNYITQGIHGASYGEFVHFRHPELYRTVSAADLAGKYAGYTRFTVVRDPVARVTSYFMMNVTTRALKREGHGQEAFMGLTTTPGPRQVARDFHHYRQLFIDFRHHTDPIAGYIGALAPHLDHIYRMKDIPLIRERLSEVYRKDIPDERAMVSAEAGEVKALCRQEFEAFRDWYAPDAAWSE